MPDYYCFARYEHNDEKRDNCINSVSNTMCGTHSIYEELVNDSQSQEPREIRNKISDRYWECNIERIKLSQETYHFWNNVENLEKKIGIND